MALTATPEAQALLLEIQAFDTRLQQLDHRAKNLPELASLTVVQRELDDLARSHAELVGAKDDISIELRRLESDVTVVEARIARDSARLQTSSSVKDVAALEQELQALAKRLSDLEEIELTVMERLETQEKAVRDAAANVADARSRASALETARDAALEELRADRSTVADARQALASRVPDDLLALYEKQRARYGWGASHLRGGVSSASGVRLNESDMSAIRASAADVVLLCPDSNAILVRTAESGI